MKRDIDVFTYLYKHIKELLDTKVEQEIDASEIGETTLINADSLGGRYTASDIDTIRDNVKSPTVVITQAEYDALPDEKKNTDIVYYITDAPFDSPNVVDISQEEYNALPDNVKYDGRFYCIDGTLYRLGRKFNNGVSNSNILDNPFFTVNQRNQSSYSGASGISADRWSYNYMTVSILSEGVSVKKDANQADGSIHQSIERNASLCGQTLTLSAIIDGNLISHTFIMPTAESGNYARYEHVMGNIKIGVLDWNNFSGNIKQQFIIYALDDNVHTIKCVKVERGDKSTLKFDSAPDYATELLKCQRYFQKYVSYLFVGTAWANNYISTSIPLSVHMRAKPVAVITAGTSNVYYNNDAWSIAQSSYISRTSEDFVEVISIVSGFTVKTAILGMTNIEVSADL